MSDHERMARGVELFVHAFKCTESCARQKQVERGAYAGYLEGWDDAVAFLLQCAIEAADEIRTKGDAQSQNR